MWEDYRGWNYKVMRDLAGNFRARYQKPGHEPNVGWKSCKQFNPRKTFIEAQMDLNDYAKAKNFKVACKWETDEEGN